MLASFKCIFIYSLEMSPIQLKSYHALNKYKVFRFKSLEATKKFLKENGICFL